MGVQSVVDREEKYEANSSPLERAFAMLEFVAERGGATANKHSDALGYSTPSVYRLAKALVLSGYFVHL